MAYTTPKTNWLAGDSIGAADLNRIEENTRTIYSDIIKHTFEVESTEVLSSVSTGSIVTTTTAPTMFFSCFGPMVYVRLTAWRFVFSNDAEGPITIIGRQPASVAPITQLQTGFTGGWMATGAAGYVQWQYAVQPNVAMTSPAGQGVEFTFRWVDPGTHALGTVWYAGGVGLDLAFPNYSDGDLMVVMPRAM